MPQWNCASCSRPLRRVGNHTAVNWKYDHCSLSWITRASLVGVIGGENLKKVTERLESALPATRCLTCPECETATFRTLSIGSTEIDVCMTCHGLILDPGEVVQAIHQHLNPPPSGITALDVASGASGIIDIVSLVAQILTAFSP